MVLESNIHSTEIGPNLNWLVDKERRGNSRREERKMGEAVTVLQKSSSREHSWSTVRNHCCANTDVKRRIGDGHMVPAPWLNLSVIQIQPTRAYLIMIVLLTVHGTFNHRSRLVFHYNKRSRGEKERLSERKLLRYLNIFEIKKFIFIFFLFLIVILL